MRLFTACAILLLVAGAATAQPVDRFVTVNGLRIHYVDWGPSTSLGASATDKPPLILIHGLDRVGRTFDHVAPHFTSRFRVIAYDMRGHGDSDWDPQARYVVEDHVTDLEGLVQQLGLRNITLWGNSTGGRVVQVFAGKRPELVARVISEDVGPERPQQISDIRPYVRHGTKRRADGRIVWKRDPNLVKGFVVTDLWQHVRNIRAPILYVLGGRSKIVPPETQEMLRKTLPQVQFVTIPDTGHYPSDEKPAEFLAIVDRFLAS
jgi:esterase